MLVYLLSLGGERLYLLLGQGCTTLKDAVGITRAEAELARRSAVMRERLAGQMVRLAPIVMDLGSRSWRGRLYEAGLVAGKEYQADSLPEEGDLRADLQEAVQLYRRIRLVGGWDAEDEIIAEARKERGSGTLEQAKRYRQHRSIERQSGHSSRVKKALGTRCMGCHVDLSERYGSVASGLIDAHHLVPLSTLGDGDIVHFDPETDFAVLCPNCHRVIHRMSDPSDLEGLRLLISSEQSMA